MRDDDDNDYKLRSQFPPSLRIADNEGVIRTLLRNTAYKCTSDKLNISRLLLSIMLCRDLKIETASHDSRMAELQRFYCVYRPA